MKVSILVSDLSENPIVRVYPIAKVLERNYSVELIGPVFGKGIFPAYADEFTFKTIQGCNYPGFFRQMLQVIKKIDGDVIYVFKPRPSSFFPGLLASWLQKKPLLVDIDDCELAPYHENPWIDRPFSGDLFSGAGKHQTTTNTQFWLTGLCVSLPRSWLFQTTYWDNLAG